MATTLAALPGSLARQPGRERRARPTDSVGEVVRRLIQPAPCEAFRRLLQPAPWADYAPSVLVTNACDVDFATTILLTISITHPAHPSPILANYSSGILSKDLVHHPGLSNFRPRSFVFKFNKSCQKTFPFTNFCNSSRCGQRILDKTIINVFS